MEEVKVSIDEEGNVKLTVFGAKGPQCLEITKDLEALLGGRLEREFTSEYYSETEQVRERQRVKDRS